MLSIIHNSESQLNNMILLGSDMIMIYYHTMTNFNTKYLSACYLFIPVERIKKLYDRKLLYVGRTILAVASVGSMSISLTKLCHFFGKNRSQVCYIFPFHSYCIINCSILKYNGIKQWSVTFQTIVHFAKYIFDASRLLS